MRFEAARTDEDRLKNVTKGRTKEELREARREYQEKFDEDMDGTLPDPADVMEHIYQ